MKSQHSKAKVDAELLEKESERKSKMIKQLQDRIDEMQRKIFKDALEPVTRKPELKPISDPIEPKRIVNKPTRSTLRSKVVEEQLHNHKTFNEVVNSMERLSLGKRKTVSPDKSTIDKRAMERSDYLLAKKLQEEEQKRGMFRILVHLVCH